MKHKTITAVEDEPVTLTEVRLQCKIDSDDETHDTLLSSLCTAAREFAEHYTGRALAEVTLEAALDEFPSCDYIDLPMPPVSAITSIKYTDTAGVEQTMDDGDYALSTYGDSRRVSLTYGASWPSTRCQPDAVRIQFVTGYATEDLPRAVKAALLLHIETESPLNPLTPTERAAMEKARDSLLDTVKVYG
jgi:uncharacterized phiE125 gp8 family phage protein